MGACIWFNTAPIITGYGWEKDEKWTQNSFLTELPSLLVSFPFQDMYSSTYSGCPFCTAFKKSVYH